MRERTVRYSKRIERYCETIVSIVRGVRGVVFVVLRSAE